MSEPDPQEVWLALNPHLGEFMPLLATLNSESERGAVLVAVSFLEEQLGHILRAFMLDAATALILNLINRAHYVERERLKPRAWPI